MRLIDADAFIERFSHTPMVQEALKIAMDKMPTIEPKRKKGHWIPIDEDSDVYECDVCRTTYDTICGTFDLPYFCPNCGADMRGDQNG
jgi:rubrerythrin